MHDSQHFLADPKLLPINFRRRWGAICAALLILMPASAALAEGNITLVRVPDGGIQPQIATDDQGTLHRLYFKGDASSGYLFYARQ